MPPSKPPYSTLVYSSDSGRVQDPGAEAAGVSKNRDPARPPADGVVRISRQTKGRKGKGVSCVTGLALSPGELEDLARRLKQRCGAGGSVKDGVIEIQGDHREVLASELKSRGFRVKLAGG